MYKDKEKQREANKQAKARQRARQGMTEGVTNQGMTPVIREPSVIPSPRRGKDITKFDHLPVDVQATINRLSDDEQEHGRRTAIAINYQHLFPDRYHCTGTGGELVSNPVPVRVSKPGDADYKPLCEPATATGTVKGGICWCCGADIHTALVCCGPCTGSGKAEAQRAGREPLVIGQQAWEDMYVYCWGGA